MEERSLADIPFSFLEYRAVFREPAFDAWFSRSGLLAAIFRAFQEWRIGLDNVTWKQNPANASEWQLMFTLPGNWAVFSVGLGFASVFVTNPDWRRAENIIKLTKSGMGAVRAVLRPEVDKQLATMAMHLKPRDRSIGDITSRFVRVDGLAASGPPVRTYGFSLYREDRSWVVDASMLDPNALFARINRTFPAAVELEEISARLREEENQLLDLLQLRVD